MIEIKREKTIVQADGTVQIQLPTVAPGTVVEVIVLVEQQSKRGQTLLELRASTKGAHGSADEVVKHIRELRDEWDTPEEASPVRPSDEQTDQIPIAKLWGTGQGCYASPEEADQFLRELRDEWDD